MEEKNDKHKLKRYSFRPTMIDPFRIKEFPKMNDHLK